MRLCFFEEDKVGDEEQRNNARAESEKVVVGHKDEWNRVE